MVEPLFWIRGGGCFLACVFGYGKRILSSRACLGMGTALLSSRSGLGMGTEPHSLVPALIRRKRAIIQPRVFFV